MEIGEALSTLDPSDDAQWTSDGMPRLDVVRQLTGDATLTRKDVTEAAPELTRESVQDAEVAKELEVEIEIDLVQDAEVDIGTAREALDLAEQKKDLDDRINELSMKRDLLVAEIEALSRQRSVLQRQEFGRNTSEDDTKARLEFIKRQTEERMKRAQRGRAFLESGLRVGDVDPRSPIDRAFSRKTSRGGARPVRQQQQG